MADSANVPVLRIIARLNVGGPAIQAINLTSLLEAHGYATVLLRGREAPEEGSMDHLASAIGVHPKRVPGLRRELGVHDLRALWEVMRWIRRVRPVIVHTHTAKAGAIGRMAALLTPGYTPPVIVHTFHGHVFEGEFSARVSALFARVERVLARRTTRIVTVSEEVRQDLLRLRVAPPERVEVIRLGFDLGRFADRDEDRQRIRSETRERLGIPQDARVVSVVARVVKVKRIDRFLAMASLLRDREDVWFVVVGDGDRRRELEQTEAARGLGERLVWTGFERDIAAVCFASDVVALTSDNEGTPVALIEAQAAGLPVVSTDVGGVETVVLDHRTGRIVGKSPQELAQAVAAYLDDPAAAAAAGAQGRAHVLAQFSIDRLVGDVHELYSRLLREAGRQAPAGEEDLVPAVADVR